MMPSITTILVALVFFSASVGYAGYKGYSLGVQHEQVKAAIERERITKVNRDALEESRKRIEVQRKLIETQAVQLRTLEDEANADVNAGNISLGIDSVRHPRWR